MADSGFFVELVYARPDAQVLMQVKLQPGATVLEAVQASGLAQRFPEIDLDRLDAGIFSKPVANDTVLRSGDRVEIYRELSASPKEMRRQRARRDG
jgi:putative ubiquitin-RnfH superfamily antitoxin RatB of RatAB toxin-antitoxin module